MNDKPLHCVDVVTASAGTGKTYALTSRIEDDVLAGRDPSRIVATTFTIKAADELRDRARQRLLARGDAAGAVRMLGARVGTINGVCGGLVKEFAFGLGLSPIVEVVDENAAKAVFRKAATDAISVHADQLSELAFLFGGDWLKDVTRVVELARANNISPADLKESARRSREGVSGLMLPPLPGETEASLDAAMASECAAVLSAMEGAPKIVNATKAALEDARSFIDGRPDAQPWQKWAKAAKGDVGAKDRGAFAGLAAAAAAFARHPRLLRQAGAYVDGVFACAAAAMQAYDAYKRAWGLVDFVDQDRLALQLLGRPELEQQLRERLQTVFVDEFQDTSPLQIAVFVAMSRLAGSSVWVGDPKQSIYRFRQTDPDLIVHVAQDIREATGGAPSTLDKNWRSRPGLVSFFNDAFAPTFVAQNLPEDATRILKVNRVDAHGMGTPLNFWHVQTQYRVVSLVSSLVAGVLDTLAKPEDWIVADGRDSRPLAAGDVAILCRSNDACLQVAANLARSGLKVAIQREGLFGTIECRLALAALRWSVDQRDTVALAEMAHLFSDGAEQPAWYEASLVENGLVKVEEMVPIVPALRAVAEIGTPLTPLEFMDAVLGAGGVFQSVLRFGDVEDRLLNLESLRGLVADYAEERRRARASATVSDLCAWLAEQEADQPRSRSKDAVTVMTYHGSKGLEWPLVILFELDSMPRGNAFGVQAVSDVPSNEIDWNDPLAGRWIRLWPWPVGKQEKDVVFDVAAAATPEGVEAVRAEMAERARLLYVGATRARDYLVMAIPKIVTQQGTRFEAFALDELVGDSGQSVLSIPAVGDGAVNVNGVLHPVRVAAYVGGEAAGSAVSAAYSSAVVEPVVHPPLRLRPSDAARDDEACLGETVDLGGRLPFGGTPDMTSVGEAVHRFLAADHPTRDEEWRVALAMRLLEAWGVTSIDPRHLVLMGSRFRQFVDARWPGAVLHREAPITWRDGDRTMNGRLDLVVEAPDEIVVIDHKSYPGWRKQWEEQARKYAGQLRLYRDAIMASQDVVRPVRLALHLPVSGEILFVE